MTRTVVPETGTTYATYRTRSGKHHTARVHAWLHSDDDDYAIGGAPLFLVDTATGTLTDAFGPRVPCWILWVPEPDDDPEDPPERVKRTLDHNPPRPRSPR